MITLFTGFDPLWLSWIYLSASQHTVITEKRKVFLFHAAFLSSPINSELTTGFANPFSVVFYSPSVFTICEINVWECCWIIDLKKQKFYTWLTRSTGKNGASCWCPCRFNYSSLLLSVLRGTRTKKAIKFQKGQMKRAKPRQNFR